MSRASLELETLQGKGATGAAAASRVVTLTVLAHPEPHRVGERAQLPGLAHARARVVISRAEPSFFGHAPEGAPLMTPFISRKPVWIDGDGHGGVCVHPSVGGGLLELDGVAVTAPVAIGHERLALGVVLQLGTHVALLLHTDEPFTPAPLAGALVGESEGMRRVRAAIAAFGSEASPVLVRGPTGTGKELVAAELHRASRRAGPFVAVNMAAVPASLAASELFGHARGAFSGADQAHDGYFARAHGGTLFLDEIGDTPLEVQAALLRVLETGEVQSLGARRLTQVDVRVVAATDADLEQAVAAGRFREPLLYRLATCEVRVPPLCERRADIGRLVVSFLAAALRESGHEALLRPALTDDQPWLPAALVARLARHDWPGNVRQLRGVCLELARSGRGGIALSSASLPSLEAWPGASRQVTPPAAPVPPPRAPSRAASEIDAEEIERVLVAHDYRLGAAAEALGVSRPTMNELVDRHPRLRRAQRLDADEIRRALEAARRSGLPAWRVLAVSEHGLQKRMRELGIDER